MLVSCNQLKDEETDLWIVADWRLVELAIKYYTEQLMAEERSDRFYNWHRKGLTSSLQLPAGGRHLVP